MDKAQLRENMAYFLRAIVPVCEEVGDPPGCASGRSAAADRWPAAYRVDHRRWPRWLKETVDGINNGFTMCTGSYGVRADSDLVKMVETFGDRHPFYPSALYLP
ncbi:mannonate dehydratase [Klebsiella pneumoniae]|nr:mannonate dehydratase [Klebsiella pneumoniae]